MKSLASSSLLLLLCLGCSSARATPAPAIADHGFVVAGGSIGEDGAAEAATAATGGKVLAVRWSESGGRPVYDVTVLLQNGQVRVLRVDAQTGAVSGG